MKKTGTINSEIAAVLARLGHTDKIVLADAGLPIPESVKRIDLALRRGLPSLEETLKVVCQDMVCEKIYLATEISARNPVALAKIISIVGDQNIEWLDHQEFKKLCRQARAVIRTGEMTPYANIILQSGVIF